MKELNIKKIKPCYNYIQCTADTDTIIKGTFPDPECPYSLVQRIVAVGPQVRDYKEGDLVKISFNRYRKTSIPKDSLKENMNGVREIVQYDVPYITLEDKDYLMLFDSDIDFVILEHD